MPVPLNQLPVELPKDIDLNSKGNPLDAHPTWKYVNCPKCNREAERETDTFDTFLNLLGILSDLLILITILLLINL